MDDLPAEMLLHIISYLRTPDLLHFRRTNKRVNEFCCEVLQDKRDKYPNVFLGLEIRYSKKEQQLLCHVYQSRENMWFQPIRQIGSIPSSNCPSRFVMHPNALELFLETFPNPCDEFPGTATRRPVPFSRLKIDHFRYFTRTQMTQLAAIFGQHLKELHVILKKNNIEQFKVFMNVFHAHLPKLQRLYIDGRQGFDVMYDKDPTQICQQMPHLASLKVLQISYDNYIQIMCLLSVLLKRIPTRGLNPVFIVPLIVQDTNLLEFNTNFVGCYVWSSLHCLHLIKKMVLDIGLDLYLQWGDTIKYVNKLFNNNLRLETLQVQRVASCECYPTLVECVAIAIMYSRDSLRNLYIQNVTGNLMFKYFEQTECLRNVRDLRIQFENVRNPKTMMKMVAEACPNVTSLDLGDLDFTHQVLSKIWKGFRRTRVLKFVLKVDGTSKEHNVKSLDSRISGFRKCAINGIRIKMKYGSTLSHAQGAISRRGSIMDLEDLRTLEMGIVIVDRCSTKYKTKEQLKKSLFMSMLPSFIRENPLTLSYDFIWFEQ